jgi:TetR/AcrR family transcriptional regulator, transcriptional repressor for nem operon
MARPRSFDTDRAATAMLDAFWRQGFAGTSIPDLSDATGLLPGSLYGAFGSKDAMFRLALQRYAAWLAGEMPRGLRGLDGVKAALDTIVRLTIEDPARRGCPMLNAIAEGEALAKATRGDIENGLLWMRGFYRARLAEARADAGSNADLRAVEALLFAAGVSIRILGRAKAEPRLLQDIADGAVAAARGALSHPKLKSGGKTWKARISSRAPNGPKRAFSSSRKKKS